jgi:hypothetical protein
MSWALGRNLMIESPSKAVVCYPMGLDRSVKGLYLTGDAAMDFRNSMEVTLTKRKVGGDDVGPVRIYTQHQLKIVVLAKDALRNSIADVERGDPLEGWEAICEAMAANLRRTTESLEVTYVCEDEQKLNLLGEDCFSEWLQENYAARKRNVTITRIFILPRKLRRNPRLLDVVSKMRQADIDVQFCDIEGVNRRYHQDFSVYDGKRVVYVSNWGRTDADTHARNCDNLETVRQYVDIFSMLQAPTR